MIKIGPCGVCAARPEGKNFGIARDRNPGGRHACGKTLSSAYTISWHKTREAASVARLAYRREHKGARVWFVRHWEK